MINLNEMGLAISVRMRIADDPLLLFLPGIGCTKDSFSAAFDCKQLARFSLCAIDFPGAGGSEKPSSQGYTLQSYAEITAGIVKQLAPQYVILVGHSMGGAVGVLATQLIAIPYYLISVEGNLIGQDCGIVSRQMANQDLIEFVHTGFPELLAMLRQSGRSDLIAWADWYAKCDPIALHSTAQSLVELSDSGQLLSIFKDLQGKAYVHGRLQGRLEYLLPELSDVPSYEIADAEHFPMLDSPSSFYSIITEITERWLITKALS